MQDKQVWIGGKPSTFGADLVVYDIPEGLPVPHSGFGDSVLPWNEYNIRCWKWGFLFCTQFLSDSGIFLVFCASHSELRAHREEWMAKTGFEILEHWTGVNSLPLTKGDFLGKEVCAFCCL